MDIPKYEELNASNGRACSIKLHYPEFYTYLIENFPENISFSEKLYWYYNNLKYKPACVICGKEVKFINFHLGYRKYCSQKCMQNDPEILDKKKKTSLERYGVENAMQSDEKKQKLKQTNLKRYGVENPFMLESIKEKIRETNRSKLGVEYPMQSKKVRGKSKDSCLKKYGKKYANQSADVIDKISQTHKQRYGGVGFASTEISTKCEKTNLDRYGTSNYFNTQEYKDLMKKLRPEIIAKMKATNLARYGVVNYTQTDEYKQKEYNTKKENNSFHTSKIEKDFKNWLDENHINYKYQYRSDSYPFNCDFYFPDKDLYFEIQGSWVHGPHPFDSTSAADLCLLDELYKKNTKYYINAIETWTVRDPGKRQWAKEHKLNWVEVFSNNLNEVIKNYNQIP